LLAAAEAPRTGAKSSKSRLRRRKICYKMVY